MRGDVSEALLESTEIPLDEIDVSNPQLFKDDTVGAHFARLRREDPIHYCKDGMFGAFWSVTRFRDIKQVELNPEVFSSDIVNGGITIVDRPLDKRLPMFIAQDPPKHGVHRNIVRPILTSTNLDAMTDAMRNRTCKVLDDLPRNEVFDWVKEVSVELTTQMLAVLFDFPFEERQLLTRWSDAATSIPSVDGVVASEEAYAMELGRCLAYFSQLRNRRAEEPQRTDLISMLAHSPEGQRMGHYEFLGNVLLLLIGGNDTTRNSMSGGLHALLKNPGDYQRLRANPSLITSLVPEIIRWQTPLAHMRRTAMADTTLGGKSIRKGDKVILWYLSGNRDESEIENPDKFVIDRVRPRHHLAFGFGIHHCVGSRLAELQLQILWQEILVRFSAIELAGPPVRTLSNFVHGFTSLPIRIPK